MKKSLTNGQKKEFSTFDFFEKFSTDEKCLEHYMSLNWPPGTPAPNGSLNYKPNNGLGTFRTDSINGKRQTFSVFKDTIFWHSHIAMRQWYLSIYEMLTASFDRVASEVAIKCGMTEATAYDILYKIRSAVPQNQGREFYTKCSVDLTFIKGKNERRKWSDKLTDYQGVIVLGIVSGKRCWMTVLKDKSADEIKSVLERKIYPGSLIVTDSGAEFSGIDTAANFFEEKIGLVLKNRKKLASLKSETIPLPHFFRGRVNHNAMQFKNDGVSSNDIEGLFSILKKAYRVHNCLNPEKIPTFLDWVAFKYNNRDFPVDETFDNFIRRVGEQGYTPVPTPGKGKRGRRSYLDNYRKNRQKSDSKVCDAEASQTFKKEKDINYITNMRINSGRNNIAGRYTWSGYYMNSLIWTECTPHRICLDIITQAIIDAHNSICVVDKHFCKYPATLQKFVDADNEYEEEPVVNFAHCMVEEGRKYITESGYLASLNRIYPEGTVVAVDCYDEEDMPERKVVPLENLDYESLVSIMDWLVKHKFVMLSDHEISLYRSGL